MRGPNNQHCAQRGDMGPRGAHRGPQAPAFSWCGAGGGAEEGIRGAHTKVLVKYARKGGAEGHH